MREVEVVGTVVGDTVLVELGKRKKGKIAAALLEVVKPSPDRIAARCAHAGSCGGCSWQQKSYAAQLQTKEVRLQQLFPIKVDPIIPCDDPWHYRNKMEFSFSQNKKGERFLGLIIARSRGHVLNLEECHLTSPWFIEVLSAVRDWWERSTLLAYHSHSDRGSLRTLTVREGKRTGDKMIFLTISGNHDYFVNNAQLESFKAAVHAALPGESPSIFLRIQRICKGKPTDYYEMHLDGPDFIRETLRIKGREMHFHISPTSFFQPNTLQAEKLYARALELASPQPTDTLFDLYCGTATLAILFAPYVKRVVAIELSPYAVSDANVNVAVNQLSNITILKGDVGKKLAEINERPDLVLLDPPRSGLDPTALKELIALSPKKILYISCNPTTQSENISILLESGYELKSVQGVDQFPHTPHIENIAVLIKT